MRMIFGLLVFMSFGTAQASILGDSVVQCMKGDISVNIKSESGFWGGTQLSVLQKGKLVLSESMDEEEYQYNERLGLYNRNTEGRVGQMMRLLAENKMSIYGDDFHMLESDNALLHVFQSQLNPEFGGAPTTIVLRLNNGSGVAFKFKSECKTVSGRTRISW